MHDKIYALATGNPFYGLTFTGPFETVQDAAEYAEDSVEGDWWVVEIERPAGRKE